MSDLGKKKRAKQLLHEKSSFLYTPASGQNDRSQVSMQIEFLLGGILTLFLLLYLVYALIYPEKF